MNFIIDNVFEMLSEGVRNRKDEFHTLVFSNIENNRPVSRYVVLRDFDREKRILTFNTDRRSPKVRSIELNPFTNCLFYHSFNKTQLRISTESNILNDNEIVDDIWKNTPLTSRKCYLTKYGPSAEIDFCDDGIAEHLAGRIPSLDESENGRKNFVVIQNTILEIDWLYLSSKGHQRAKFKFSKEAVTSKWLAP